MASGTVKITLLNPPQEISSLKLRSWLHMEADQIDRSTKDDDLVLIRLFLMERVRYGFTSKKLDAIIQNVVEKFPSIFRIELILVKSPLTLEQIQEEAAKASEETKIMAARLEEAIAFDQGSEDGLIQYFGYNTEASSNESPFDFPETGLVCMVSNITEHNKNAISQQSGKVFEVGQWFISENSIQSTVIHGPFENDSQSMDFAREKCSAIRFKSAPLFG